MQNHRSAGRFRRIRPNRSIHPPRATRATRATRSLAAFGLVSALLLTATGCFGPSRPAPHEAAGTLSRAISTGDYAGVPLTPEARDVPGLLEEALTDLQDSGAGVVVTSAEVDAEDSGRATAALTVEWQLDEGDTTGEVGAISERNWSYDTTAELVWDEEGQEWLVDLAPDTVVPGLETGGTVQVTEVPAERGSILDGAGEELMMERDVAVLGLDKSRLAAAGADSLAAAVAESAAAVAEAAGVNVEAFVARAEAAAEQAFVPAITLRDNGVTEIPTAQMAEIPGGRVLEDTAVLAPSRAFARDVLGTYGEPDAEQIEASDGELRAGVEVGLSGLQADWQEHLAGSPGVEITIDNPDASDAPDGTAAAADPVFRSEPTPGRDLTSTLNRQVQAEAEAVVAASEVPAGLVALRPSDGQVLAAASGPEGWPVAVSGSYAPGSTFKVVTALALLRSGLAPEDTVQCPASINVGGMVIGNYDGYPAASVGQIPFSEAFAESCNTVFVGSYQDLSAADETEAAEALGLAADPVTGLDSAFLASVPDDSTGTEHAANLFGQGVVETSPLGMATVAASVAAGHTVRPVFVTDPAVEVPAAPETGITAAEAGQLQELMAGVVETGTAEMLQDVPGAPVLAKTGTAQFVADGEDLAHTWLIAIHGDLAVALFFNEGLGGGYDNGPVVRDFLTAVEEFLPSGG
ncbi:penicillin-binding transpeptidase domain-containing protein [Citricoccus sp. NPDC055426]|uniref:penicillin-binding transpeptidase domain-containing protein n=1 Tax=Citricoccus sp. NPDC055426 TaxID=3155536 RepID=UPI0034282450